MSSGVCTQKGLYQRLNARWLCLRWDEQASVLVMLVTLVVSVEIILVLHLNTPRAQSNQSYGVVLARAKRI